MYIIYNLLMIGAFFLVMPYFIYRSICEKGFTRRMRQSLGGIRDEEIEAVALNPLDLPFVSESVVKRIRPRIFMPVETELWPNLLRALRERNIPVMMVNGRISGNDG